MLLPDSAIRQYHTKLMYPQLIKIITQPRGTTVDRLVAEFSKQNNLSYLYITHNLQFGFITHKKEKMDEPIVEDEKS